MFLVRSKLKAYGTIEVIANGKTCPLSLFLKIVLFSSGHAVCRKVIPYDGLVSSIIGLFDFPQRQSFYSFHTG